jgi:DNA replication protein DnaC
MLSDCGWFDAPTISPARYKQGSAGDRRYERASTLLTSNRPVEDWGKLLGDSAAVSAMLDRLLHHGHVLKCGPRSWRTKTSGEGKSQ